MTSPEAAATNPFNRDGVLVQGNEQCDSVGPWRDARVPAKRCAEKICTGMDRWLAQISIQEQHRGRELTINGLNLQDAEPSQDDTTADHRPASNATRA